MFAPKNHFWNANERVSYLGFRETFAALFVLSYWSRVIPLSAIGNRFELGASKSK